MMCFFSIIIPLYNMERHIRRSMGSALSQTFTDFEVIVVDDGSLDKGPAIVLSYADPRIRLIQQPNAGVSAARNSGIAEAKGEWITFLDADDEYRPQLLQKFYETIDIYPQIGAVFCRLAICWGDKVPTPPSESELLRQPVLINDYFSFLNDKKRGGYGFHASSTAIHSEIFNKTGLFPVGVKCAEDVDLWYRIAFTTVIGVIPAQLAVYHIENNVPARVPPPSAAYWFDTFDVWRKENRIPTHLKKSASRFYASECLSGAINNVLLNRRPLSKEMIRQRLRIQDAPILLLMCSVFIVYVCPRFLLTGANWLRKRFR